MKNPKIDSKKIFLKNILIVFSSFRTIHLKPFFSLLSGCSDGSVYIHDVNNLTGRPQYTAKCICKVVKNSDYTHRYSVECVSWYGEDSALFITSGTDKTLKIWDANYQKSIEQFNSKGRIFHHDCSFIPTSNPKIAGKNYSVDVYFKIYLCILQSFSFYLKVLHFIFKIFINFKMTKCVKC